MTDHRRVDRVYAIPVDTKTERVAINIKDATLPEELRIYEGLIDLFGGGKQAHENVRTALARELDEELGTFSQSLPIDCAVECHYHPVLFHLYFVIQTDLTGDRHNRGRIQQLIDTCTEGEGSVRSFDFLRRSADNLFAPGVKEAILAAIDACTP